MIRLFTILFLLHSYSIFAQQNKSMERKGLMLGFSTGLANSHFTFPSSKQTSTDVALNWKVGYMLNTKLALLVNGSISVYQYDLTDRPRKRDFGGIFPSVQYHLTPKMWLLSGIGLGTDAPVFYDLQPENQNETKYYSGLGFVSAFGYELFQHKKFAVDLQARFNYSQVNLPIGTLKGATIGLLLGINFY